MTPQEIREKRLAYPLTTEELGARVGVKVGAVRAWERGDRAPWPQHLTKLRVLFAKREGCTCTCHGPVPKVGIPHWTDAEDAELRRLVAEGVNIADAAVALGAMTGYTRTPSAIADRTWKLGLTFVRHLSNMQAQRLLGVGQKRVERWVLAGLIDAQRHVAVRSGKPSRWWAVKRDALEAFVVRYAGIEFDPSTVRDPELRALAVAAAVKNTRQAV